MSTVIVRYTFGEGNPSRSFEITDSVRRTYGGAVTYLAHDTFLLETNDSANEVFALLAHLFTYDDKLFVGRLDEYCSLHHLPQVKASMHKIAI